MKTLNSFQRLIREGTGAAIEDLAKIEHIMREEIFHSTLDWQSHEQLVEGARQAQHRLNEDRELYDFDQACRVAMFQKMRAEAAQRERDTAGNRSAVRAAERVYEAARAKLSASLDAEAKTH
jgi:hypothetical protein